MKVFKLFFYFIAIHTTLYLSIEARTYSFTNNVDVSITIRYQITQNRSAQSTAKQFNSIQPGDSRTLEIDQSQCLENIVISVDRANAQGEVYASAAYPGFFCYSRRNFEIIVKDNTLHLKRIEINQRK